MACCAALVRQHRNLPTVVVQAVHLLLCRLAKDARMDVTGATGRDTRMDATGRIPHACVLARPFAAQH